MYYYECVDNLIYQIIDWEIVADPTFVSEQVPGFS